MIQFLNNQPNFADLLLGHVLFALLPVYSDK
jgi:hypothetical protein